MLPVTREMQKMLKEKMKKQDFRNTDFESCDECQVAVFGRRAWQNLQSICGSSHRLSIPLRKYESPVKFSHFALFSAAWIKHLPSQKTFGRTTIFMIFDAYRMLTFQNSLP